VKFFMVGEEMHAPPSPAMKMPWSTKSIQGGGGMAAEQVFARKASRKAVVPCCNRDQS